MDKDEKRFYQQLRNLRTLKVDHLNEKYERGVTPSFPETFKNLQELHFKTCTALWPQNNNHSIVFPDYTLLLVNFCTNLQSYHRPTLLERRTLYPHASCFCHVKCQCFLRELKHLNKQIKDAVNPTKLHVLDLGGVSFHDIDTCGTGADILVDEVTLIAYILCDLCEKYGIKLLTVDFAILYFLADKSRH